MRTEIESLISGKTGQIYTTVLGTISSYTLPHLFIAEAYSAYGTQFKSNQSVNGRILEYCICEVLAREGIKPFYYQAKFSFTPIAEFDIVCYHPKRPVVLSVKASLRERYKQAALEGLVLKGLYGAAQSYLLSITNEVNGVKRQIEAETLVGLTNCLRADSSDFDTLLAELKTMKFMEAKPVIPLQGKRFL